MNCPTTPTAGGGSGADVDFTCTYHAGTTSGTDSVAVTATNGTKTANGTATVFVNAPAAHLKLSPTSQTTAVGNCANYTVNPVDSGGIFLRNYPVTVQVVVPNTGTTSTLSTCGSGPISGVVDTGPSGGTETLRFVVTSNADGSATSFGFTSSQTVTPSTANVTAYDNGGNSNVEPHTGQIFETATQSFTSSTAGGITVTPSTVTQVTGTTATFELTVTNASGQTLSGQQVREDVTSGPDMTAAGTVPPLCGTTDSNGKVTCTLHNTSGTNSAGTDQITFYVESNGTPGPQSGEVQGTGTAIFQAPPTNFSALSLSCPTPGATGAATSTCTIPLSQHAVVFTAHATDSSGNAVSGVPVSFSVGGTPPTTLSPTTGSGTTDASGNATFTVTDTSPTAGEHFTVTASVGAVTASATATFATPTPTNLTVTPQVQSVTQGGTVTITAKVTDQFGNGVSGDNLTATVVGRNTGTTVSSATTDANGNATISYQDTNITGASTDTVTITDTTHPGLTGNPATATVQYITGSTTPSTVTIDVSGSGTDTTCPPASGATKAKTGVALGSTTEVCAVVKNSTDEVLAGQQVTFTVDKGTVDTHGHLSSTSTKTVTVTTNGSGIAVADVTSNNSGVQNVTATDGAVSDTGTITYNPPATTAALTLALAPATTNITPGGSQQFTATVADQFGNGVPGITVTFTQAGAGSIGATSSATAITAADGTASVTVSTTASTTGSGSVTATIPSAGTSCSSTGGNCTATSTYTVATTGAAAIQLFPKSGTKVGGTEQVLVAALNADGTPAANATVQLTVSGANHASGSVTTAANGGAVFTYHATHAGSDVIHATSGTATATATAKIIRVSEKPSISVSSPHRGWAKVHSETRPSLSHVVMHFYRYTKHGHRVFIGSKLTGHGGHATLTFKHLTPGKTYKFRVRVVRDNDVVSHFSSIESQKIRKHNP
ncbi:MAG TPA: Ig-like domain-containing protein [Mycobacteriales bacterium]|nr:Ig-like domain-containing protein [Mycobacteriales bacterium]